MPWCRLFAVLATGSLGCLPLANAEAQIEPWLLTPETRYAGDPRAPLSDVWQITVGPDREIYVLDGVAKRVNVYGASGHLLRTIGREGSGPGEFLAPLRAGWLADMLWVVEPGRRRVSLFHPSGEFARAITVPAQVSPGSVFMMVSLLADGSFLGREFGPPQIRQPQPHEALTRLSEGGDPLDTVQMLSVEHREMRVSLPGGGVFQTVQPWSSHDVLAVSKSGDRIVVLDQSNDGRGATGEYEIIVVDLPEKRRSVRRVTYERVPFTEEAVDYWISESVSIDELGRFFGGPDAARRAIAREVYRPRYLPPVRRATVRPFDQTVRVGIDRSIWIQRDNQDRNTSHWDVFDERLNPVGSVSVGAGVTVHEICGGTVWGVELDDLDVPTVVRYRVMDGVSESRDWPGASSC